MSKRRWHKRSAVTEELKKQLQQKIELPPLAGLPLQQEGELEQELKKQLQQKIELPPLAGLPLQQEGELEQELEKQITFKIKLRLRNTNTKDL